jgi:hypothetical protein
MTPEGKVKRKINELLRRYDGLYKFMPVQSGLGSKTLDYLICYKGKFIGVEAKAGDNMPTALQEITIDKIIEAGGFTLVINENNLSNLKGLLDELRNGEHS